MAKVRSPFHSIDLRGRFADGVVFTNWRDINCLRTFVMPSQPNTQRKRQIWKTTPKVTRAWAGITDGERAQWEAYAHQIKTMDSTLGRASHWSGYNAYVSVNQVLADAEQPLVSQPPAIPQPNSPEKLRLENPSPGTVRILWQPLPSGTLADLWLNQGKASRKAYPSRYRHLVYADGTTGLFELPGLPAGTRVAVKARVVRADGGRSNYAQGEILV